MSPVSEKSLEVLVAGELENEHCLSSRAIPSPFGIVVPRYPRLWDNGV